MLCVVNGKGAGFAELTNIVTFLSIIVYMLPLFRKNRGDDIHLMRKLKCAPIQDKNRPYGSIDFDG